MILSTLWFGRFFASCVVFLCLLLVYSLLVSFRVYLYSYLCSVLILLIRLSNLLCSLKFVKFSWFILSLHSTSTSYYSAGAVTTYSWCHFRHPLTHSIPFHVRYLLIGVIKTLLTSLSFRRSSGQALVWFVEQDLPLESTHLVCTHHFSFNTNLWSFATFFHPYPHVSEHVCLFHCSSLFYIATFWATPIFTCFVHGPLRALTQLTPKSVSYPRY